MVDHNEEPLPSISFQDLPLSEELLASLKDVGYESATPVQAGSITPAVEGRDLMVQSQTGTGKTAAFTIPLIERFKDTKDITALVLAPTRELARQVMEEAKRLSAHSPHFSVCCIYGGVSFDDQVEEIKSKPTMIVGTPGRVIDHLRRGTLRLDTLRCFVLDEADEMLSMGFAEELEQILRYLPSERQTLFFSATFPANVKRYANKTLNDPLALSYLTETSSADDLDHYYMLLPGVARGTHLKNLLRELNPESAIIFTNTRRDAERTSQLLTKAGMDANRLSGDMDQKERDRVMRKMKDKKIRFLVATDVAARGIDISQLSHVIHYQLPDTPEVYIHRSGRTGRAGAKGEVYSLASSQDLGVIYALKRFHHLTLIERELPKRQANTVNSDPVKSENLKINTIDTERKTIDTERLTQSGRSLSEDGPSKPSRSKAQKGRRINKGISVSASQELDPPTQEQKSIPSLNQTPIFLSEALAQLSALDFSQQSSVLTLDNVLETIDQADLMSLSEQLCSSSTYAPVIAYLIRSRARTSASEAADIEESVSLTHEESAHEVELHESSVEARWLKINLGLMDADGDESSVREMIADLGGLLPEDIGQLKVKERFSLLTVDQSFESDLMLAINGESLEGRTLRIEHASANQRSSRPQHYRRPRRPRPSK